MSVITYRPRGKATTPEGEQLKLDPRDILIRTGAVMEICVDYSDYIKKFYQKHDIEIQEKIRGAAIIDTGASRSCIDSKLAQRFSFPVINEVKVSTPSHTGYTAPVYTGISLDIVAMGKSYMDLLGVEISNQGMQIIIGRDILSLGLFIYNGIDGSHSLCI